MTDRASLPTDRELVTTATRALQERLPSTWALSLGEAPQPWAPDADSVLSLRSPDGAEVAVIVEVKSVVEPRDVAAMQDRLVRLLSRHPGSIGLVVSRYLSTSARARLAEAGLSYADASGNMLVRADEPGLFLSDRGADRDPWRGPGRPRQTLAGEPAAKVVRALADLAGPWKIRELVRAAAVSTGSAYRVLAFLESEDLVRRDGAGLISVPDWRALLRRWSEDYRFLGTNAVLRCIAPRGLPAFLDQIRGAGVDNYALTGSVAAAAWQPYAPVRSVMVYAGDPEQAADAWGARATDAGTNVLIARPAYPVVLDRTTEALDGLVVAAPTQVAVDLMTGPGRAPSEAAELLDWMERHEDAWR
ncbi:hypothetical protein Athai_55640 [Actinocatenispora thailandica]|uniref:HTH iclR-type domain-containing protein n=1 Tax=Actinocatenispora thailandica TaxID=227318 RepID=A0A7R7I004_9ACTN|nr:helix-turn-helix domain-containing protein [Actinocatenispora thailandica]BCJ38061.1 hypothetical protein Athai_55640 [Actinocatenispora thailandica]